MSTDPERYRPLFWSEKLLSVLPGQPPYLGCGVSTAAHGIEMATAGEFSLMQNGRRKGKAARTNDLKRGWRAFKAKPDSNGIPDTDDYLRIHDAMQPGTPDPQKLWTRKWSDIRDALDEGYFISIAMRLSVVKGTSVSRYTTADHQAGLYEPRLHWKDKSKRLVRNGKTKDICPMHDHSNTYSGHVVNLSDVRKAAKAIEGGLILAWLYPIGGWTEANLVRKRRNAIQRELKGQVADLKADVSAAELENARLIEQLQECREDGPDDGVNDFIEMQINWLEEQRK